MAHGGWKLAMVVEELAAALEAEGETARATGLRSDAAELRDDEVRRLDIERLQRIWGGLAWLTGRGLETGRPSRTEHIRRRLCQAFN